MKFQKILRIAWEGLMLNKVRSFLTTLGVIIGVASVIVMMSISAGAEAAIAEQINSLGANLLIVSPMRGVPGAARTLLYEDALAIPEQVIGISGVSAEQAPAPQTVKASGITLESIAIVGTTADFPAVRDYPVAEGVYFTEQENDRKLKVAVLGAGLAKDLFGEESPLGQTITVGSTKLTVIGVMQTKGVVADIDYDGRVYLPISVVFQKYMTTNSVMRADVVRTIYVKVESQEKIDSVTTQITSLLATRHDVDPAKPDFTIQTQQDIIATQEATTAAFRDLLAWVAGVSLLVGGIGIMNIMLVSVTERTREIGLRMALGARPNDVQTQFLLEAVILSLVGGLAGVLLGVGGSLLFGAFGEMRTAIVPLSVPLAFGAAAAIGIFFGYYPATQAAKLDPIVALRHE
ncbi:MAG: ABC transporter permease [Anaerolineales bacterium]|jgi:putative ABC transport system permease protein|nr:ABC transporter permease [Anaerolineales bacterium]